ncbi:membrane-anchored ubiquitin-fold protein 4 precursor [Perilla frutescens var. hirtella]|uniref:Membrane-anchored ubiquitin-fold protein n=1 Tax=Perilla frutescens var. hirtella TaxID=608512 RepID=A0AAD4J623_PERFH|nr:membrane-anchored ubiquitin-fold protein 4 precursor [Perilla frutescens var. hirtella]KAH6808442.1 membrane-anchored ubiquitin-fold protein 4 precursor [Perilla frutescens var. frutescens]KAH6827614.1 membrane-anchored ubiquitin-fold protein 4 precursor [Perilla frutescens var. hirtella]
MAEGGEQFELKFRIFDGTDIGHGSYSSSITVATLKQRLLSEWPQDKTVIPKSASDMKLIHAGKVLENGKTLAESRAHAGDLPAGVITMHVVVQPAVVKKKTDKNLSGKQKQVHCSINGERVLEK